MALAVFALATLCLGARVDGFVDEIVDLDTLDEGPGSEERVQALKLKVQGERASAPARRSTSPCPTRRPTSA